MKNLTLIFIIFIFTESFPQDSLFIYPSGKEIEITVSANVIKSYSGFHYNFLVRNGLNGLQNISDFYVEFSSVIDSISSPESWLGGISEVWPNILMWNSRDSLYDISPGNLLSRFAYLSKGLPSIRSFYGVGVFEIPSFEEGKAPDRSEIVGGGILENSVQGYTIGASLLPNPYIPLAFIDTLLNYSERSFELGWILNQQTVDKYDSLFTSAKTQLQQNNNNAAKATLQIVLQQVDLDSTNNLTSEAYALLRYNTEYLLGQIPQSSPNLIVYLKSSKGVLLTSGSLQYYEGGWKDANNNGDGTFSVITNLSSVSLRMTYEYGTQTVSNVSAQNNTYTFQTDNVAVELRNSLGNLIDEGTIQYYAGAWRSLGTTQNGVATKELLPNNYSFRMTYAYASNDKQQNIGTNSTVVFQTVNASVQLQNSTGNLIDEGIVKYYAGAWRDFGTTVNGVATKELLPNNYSFRMTYANANNDKQQNIGTNSTVIFQTVNASVQLQNSTGNLIDEGVVKYYAGAWRDFSTSVNGVATKELLPNNYSFRMTYAYASNDKQQNIGTNSTVVFQTVNAAVQLQNSSGNLIDEGVVKYYAGAWRDFGTTVNGVATKELLPNNYSFRMTYEFVSNDKQQDLSSNGTVTFSTVLCTVKVSDANNQLLEGADVKYYSGAWRDIGLTNAEGIITKELLPNNLSFRAIYNSVTQDKQQDIGTNNLVEILLNVGQ